MVQLRSKDNVPYSLLLLAGMIKWATSAAGRKGYKSYSLVTAVWDRGSEINCGARNRKIKMKPLLLLYDREKREHFIRIRTMEVRKFNKQRGAGAYKWKIKTEENRRTTGCGKEHYAELVLRREPKICWLVSTKEIKDIPICCYKGNQRYTEMSLLRKTKIYWVGCTRETKDIFTCSC